MKNNKVIVTIAVGEKHLGAWEKYAKKSWERYAQKHGYDIICIREPLDLTERAVKRSPAWQKCLILQNESVAKYERVVWLDADIIINYESAPCIVSLVDAEMVGAVQAWFFPGDKTYSVIHERMISINKRFSIPLLGSDIGKKYYTDYGLPGISEDAVQTGVLVLTPKLHAPILQKVYYEYEDNRTGHWHYEMRPLSYELIQRNVVQWIDPRFNYVLEALKLAEYYHKYPQRFTDRVLRFVKFKSFKLLSALGVKIWEEELIKKGLESSYFLHFAGATREMAYAEKIIPAAR